MVGRSGRWVLLALATLAVLFAPGAAAEGSGDDLEPVSSERVAASIIAPTFGGDGLVMARSGRDEAAEQDLAASLSAAPGAGSAIEDGPAAIVATVSQRAGHDPGGRHSAPTRAPPQG